MLSFFFSIPAVIGDGIFAKRDFVQVRWVHQRIDWKKMSFEFLKIFSPGFPGCLLRWRSPL